MDSDACLLGRLGAGTVLAAGELLPGRRAGGRGAAGAAVRLDGPPGRRRRRQVPPRALKPARAAPRPKARPCRPAP